MNCDYKGDMGHNFAIINQSKAHKMGGGGVTNDGLNFTYSVSIICPKIEFMKIVKKDKRYSPQNTELLVQVS